MTDEPLDFELSSLFENPVELSFHKSVLNEGDKIIRVTDSRENPEIKRDVIRQITNVFEVKDYKLYNGNEGELVARFFLDRGKAE